MENEDNTNYHLKMLEKSFDFGRKKIIYHENSHLLFSYLFVMSCLYVDYTVNSNVQLKGENLEVEFESLAHANINLPLTLNTYLAFLHTGGSTEEFINLTGYSSEALINSTNAYLAILYAGYEAEKYFFSGAEFEEIRGYIQKYSEDFTIKNIQEDEIRSNMILSSLGFSDEVCGQIKSNAISKIIFVLNEEKTQTLFDGLFELSLSKNRLSQNDIEAFLSFHKFSEWSNEILKKLNDVNN
jgi:hypothetical protein